jgi:RNA polymerase sigma-70 factor (ECF subfamily)
MSAAPPDGRRLPAATCRSRGTCYSSRAARAAGIPRKRRPPGKFREPALTIRRQREWIGTVVLRPASSSTGSEPFKSGTTDQELVGRVMGGDGAAFGQIVERYQDRIYNAVYRLVGAPEDARDLVQDTFVKAYENLAGFRGGSSLYTWLFRIAVNTSLSHRRKRKWVSPMPASASEDDPSPEGGWADPAAPDPMDRMVAAEAERLVQQALDALDEEHRTVVVLRDIQHCDYHEIAEILDVPAGTVKSRLHRARLMLRDKLKPLLKQ